MPVMAECIIAERHDCRVCAPDKNVGSGNKYSSLLKLMQFIGTVYGGASVTQVAINYLRAKGKRV